jgi:hypothetical protein
LALEDLGDQAARPAVTVIAVTVLFSVIAHGVSAEPLARRYEPLLNPAVKPMTWPTCPPAGSSGGHQRRAQGLCRRTGQAD